MSEFWDNKFQEIGTIWSFEPSDSAIFTCKLFTGNNFKRILIPGVGYGRNARPFIESGIDVTGIEISKTAIELARKNGMDFRIHHGSVLKMPFGKESYDGIFCYALLHLFNQNDRRQFLKNCYNQLREGGMMVFVVVSKNYKKLTDKGKLVSKDRFWMEKGLTVFFYDSESVEKEFAPFGLAEYHEIDEPVKHLEGEESMKFWRVICRKKVIGF
ncbi:MAG TPA: SAM-dependent methyltransferase [Prolixibacteraceae bacterium]|nr:SAM-dependent methyltransferase [Prolixibacteraceae bacterium]